MRISTVCPLVSALATLAVVACASSQQYESSSAAAGMVDLSAYPTPTLDASETQLLQSMSDADILGHLITVDSMELATADSAIRFSKRDDILAFARMMHAAHEANLQRDRDLAKQTGITPVTAFGGLRASHVAAMLDSVTDGN